MSSDIVTFILNLVISFVFFVVQLITLPIDLIIQQMLPGVSTAFTAIGNLFNLIAQGLGWAISASGIPYAAIALIATYWIFKLGFPVIIWGIKLAIKWYNAIKL